MSFCPKLLGHLVRRSKRPFKGVDEVASTYYEAACYSAKKWCKMSKEIVKSDVPRRVKTFTMTIKIAIRDMISTRYRVA
jgi:hypothetical protein